MKTQINTIIAVTIVLISSCFGAVLNIPEQYATIQSAIDAASANDEIVLAPGVYTGSGNRSINFRGKSVTLRSTVPTDWEVVNNTIIDCGGSSRAMSFFMAETSDTIVEGITITNGNSTLGGAIYCYNHTSPVIRNCIFINNKGVLGGAIAFANTNTAALVTNCIITSNTALVSGGGIYCNGAKPQIKNCMIVENTASEGGGIYIHNPSNAAVSNCTISQNYASTSASAIYCHSDGEMTVKNSIVWGNSSDDNIQIRIGSASDSASAKISFCNIENPNMSIVCMSSCTLDYGPGNLETDPLLVGLIDEDYDYHIQKNSPCINKGDPEIITASYETDIDGEERVAGTGIDIGADETPALSIEAEIKITPSAISLKCNGNYINCIITLPAEYGISTIDTGSIRLNDEVVPISTKIDVADQQATAKFDRDNVIEVLDPNEESAVITISGLLNDGVSFTGTDTVKLAQYEFKGFKKCKKAHYPMFWCRKSHCMKSRAYIKKCMVANSNKYTSPKEKWSKTWNVKFKTNKCAAEWR